MTLLQGFLFLLHVTLALVAIVHALMYKRDVRAALGWMSVCIFFPLAGPLIYFVFGVNRVRTRARQIRHGWRMSFWFGFERGDASIAAQRLSLPPPGLPELPGRKFAVVSEVVSKVPQVAALQVTALDGGAIAYAQMLAAIETAQESVYLATYIFDTAGIGTEFVTALAAAHARGVRVRVLVDGFGELYAWPLAVRVLRRAGIRAARFLPLRLLPPALHFNLRNHRKILTVDERIGFTGGMNIRPGHASADVSDRACVRDLHFRFEGPIATQLADVFREDWLFAARESLPQSQPASDIAVADLTDAAAVCRTIVDGPNEDLDKLAMILLGVVSAARERVIIVTPYFLPSRDLVGALQAAVLRGVRVDVVLPARNNLPFVHWATRNMLWELLQWGVRVYYQPPPFAHTKLFVADGEYVLVGSANIDPRSLRLNFELAVEICSCEFAAQMEMYVNEQCTAAEEVSLEALDRRPFGQRLRDALSWLASPYL